MSARIAVIHYSSTGVIHSLASALAAGAAEAGAEVRLRRVPELAPAQVPIQTTLSTSYMW